MYDQKTGQWEVPAAAREYTTTHSFRAVVVKDPRDFPGVAIQQTVSLAGAVLEWHYVLDTSPFGGIYSWVRPGYYVLYPDDPSTNMLQVKSGKDFVHWHPEAAEEQFNAEWGDYPGAYPEGGGLPCVSQRTP